MPLRKWDCISRPRGGSGWDGVELRCASYFLAHWRKLALATWGSSMEQFRGCGEAMGRVGARNSAPKSAIRTWPRKLPDPADCGIIRRMSRAHKPESTISRSLRCPLSALLPKSGFFFCGRSRIRFQGMRREHWSPLKHAESRSRIHEYRGAFGKRPSPRRPAHVSYFQPDPGR